jgi:hypothetical protein
MYMYGGVHYSDGAEAKLRSVDGVPIDEHAKPDPRVEYLKARTRDLTELHRRLDAITPLITAAVERVKRR